MEIFCTRTSTSLDESHADEPARQAPISRVIAHCWKSKRADVATLLVLNNAPNKPKQEGKRWFSASRIPVCCVTTLSRSHLTSKREASSWPGSCLVLARALPGSRAEHGAQPFRCVCYHGHQGYLVCTGITQSCRSTRL